LPQDESFYNYVVSKACAILFRSRALVEPEGGWAEKAEVMEVMAEGFFDLDRPPVTSKPVRSTMLSWG
jgi:hypothetical protein